MFLENQQLKIYLFKSSVNESKLGQTVLSNDLADRQKFQKTDRSFFDVFKWLRGHDRAICFFQKNDRKKIRLCFKKCI